MPIKLRLGIPRTSFLDAHMLAQFIQEDTLSDDDINELRLILDKKPKKQ
jgi:predicted transcriptional regulator